jgi:hypothetical protein
MVIDARSTIYLVVLLCMLNMSVQIEICAREVTWRMNNNGKPTNFHDILYCLNVIFLQCVFEGLNNVFSYSKTRTTKCTKALFISATQIKYLGESFLMV